METDEIIEDVQEEHPRGRMQLSPLAGVLVLISTAGGNVPTASPSVPFRGIGFTEQGSSGQLCVEPGASHRGGLSVQGGSLHVCGFLPA